MPKFLSGKTAILEEGEESPSKIKHRAGSQESYTDSYVEGYVHDIGETGFLYSEGENPVLNAIVAGQANTGDDGPFSDVVIWQRHGTQIGENGLPAVNMSMRYGFDFQQILTSGSTVRFEYLKAIPNGGILNTLLNLTGVIQIPNKAYTIEDEDIIVLPFPLPGHIEGEIRMQTTPEFLQTREKMLLSRPENIYPGNDDTIQYEEAGKISFEFSPSQNILHSAAEHFDIPITKAVLKIAVDEGDGIFYTKNIAHEFETDEIGDEPMIRLDVSKKVLGRGTFLWRIRCFDANGLKSLGSKVSSFTLQ